MMKRLANAFLFIILLVLAFFSNGCDGFYFSNSTAQKKLQQRGLRVAILEHPLIHAKAPKGFEPTGLDHDLIANLGKAFALKIRWFPVRSQGEALEKVRRGEADLAVTRSSDQTPALGLRMGPALEETQLSLFCPRQMGLRDDANLKNEVLLISEKDNHFKLESQALDRYPKANVQVIDAKPRDLFTLANERKKTCVIAETLEGMALIQTLPHMAWVDQISDSFSIGWLLRANDKDLHSLLQAWYQRASRADEIVGIHDRYLSRYTILKPHDLRRFFKNKQRLLSQWKSDFEEAGELNKIPWTLIAAISYQESHWDEHARSYTGVRGLMQLTEETAAHMGVKDRKDPQQSIFGGARYFRYLLDLTPEHLPLEERVSLALTAYNLGWGHLMDAQSLAVKKGLNPSSWRHLHSILPLLANPAYASQLQYGHARGQEAQDFVERVKAFEHLLRITDLR